MNCSILHITDMHLNNFDGALEHLRSGFYEEYIDDLFTEISKKEMKVDYLILTGDFIDKGKVENFSHVKEIIKYISSKFSITLDKICCTIGNHDYKWHDEAGDFTKSAIFRKPYNEFVSSFDTALIVDCETHKFKKIGDNIFYLALDSTYRSIGGCPGQFEISEIDEIINKTLKKNVNEESILLIGCHFPIFSDESNFLASEEPDWHKNHVWINGNGTELRERISKIITKHTVWFHGDVHAGDQKIIKSATYITTGRFGGATDKPSEFPRQCKIITLNDAEQSYTQFNYIFKTHQANSQLGNWQGGSTGKIRTFANVLVKKETTNDLPENYIRVINPEIESEILDDISNKCLFKFGRYKTSKLYSTIGWININSLMNQPELLSRILEKSYIYLEKKLEAEQTKCLILGMEVIGGIIASQLAVRLNIKNFIFPLRGSGLSYSSVEIDKSLFFSQISEIKEIVLFIDVISSGQTIKEFIDVLYEKNNSIILHVISIISNDIPEKLLFFEGVKSYGTFCSKMKIPIILNENLPPESILPSTISFTSDN